MSCRRRLAPVLVSLCFSATVLARVAYEIRVTPVIADGTVAASFSAGAALPSDARDVVESGLLVTLTFTVDLKRPATGWWDQTVGSRVVASSVKFDNLNRTYHVSRLQDDHVIWSDRTKDFAEARGWLTTFERVQLASDDQLQPNAEYYVRVRMRASPRRTFPFWPWNTDDGVGRADFTFIR